MTPSVQEDLYKHKRTAFLALQYIRGSRSIVCCLVLGSDVIKAVDNVHTQANTGLCQHTRPRNGIRRRQKSVRRDDKIHLYRKLQCASALFTRFFLSDQQAACRFFRQAAYSVRPYQEKLRSLPPPQLRGCNVCFQTLNVVSGKLRELSKSTGKKLLSE